METTQQELLSELNSEFAREVLPVTIFVGIEIGIGFFSNVFVFYMFARHHPPSNYRTFILCLSFIDFLCTITTMPGEIIGHRYWYMYPSYVICKTKDFFNIFTVSAETFCLLLISIERYHLVSYDDMGRGHAVLYCCFSYLVAALLAYPVTVFWGVRTYTKDYKSTQVNVTLCEKDKLYTDTYFPEGYEMCIGCILTLILIVVILIYVKIGRQSRQSRIDDDLQPEIMRQTKIFACITGLFFVTTLIYFTMISILGNSDNIVNSWSDKSKVVFFLFLRFYFIQHVMNPFIYGLSDRSMRYYITTYICDSCRSTPHQFEQMNKS